MSIASYPWIVRRAAWHSRQPCVAGDMNVAVDGVNITTDGPSGRGVDVDHKGEDTGHITIDVEHSRITTTGYKRLRRPGIPQ